MTFSVLLSLFSLYFSPSPNPEKILLPRCPSAADDAVKFSAGLSSSQVQAFVPTINQQVAISVRSVRTTRKFAAPIQKRVEQVAWESSERRSCWKRAALVNMTHTVWIGLDRHWSRFARNYVFTQARCRLLHLPWLSWLLIVAVCNFRDYFWLETKTFGAELWQENDNNYTLFIFRRQRKCNIVLKFIFIHK